MRVALVDALDAFDPQSHEAPLLQHLVWVRCRTLDEAMQAADILVRDANLSLVMLDLRGVEPRALRGVPATTWYRLQRALERTDMAMVVFTAEGRDVGKSGNRETAKSENLGPPILLRQGFGGPASGAPTKENTQAANQESGNSAQSGNGGLVGSARLRFNLAASLPLDALTGEQTGLALGLPVEVQRRHANEERRIA